MQIGPSDLLAADPEVLQAMIELLAEQDRAAEKEQRRSRLRSHARGRG